MNPTIENATIELLAHGQSCWMDDLTRGMIRSGDLARRVAEEGLRGITSNPSIFEKAIAEGAEYDEEIARGAAEGRSPAGLYEELITADVRDACDILRRVYDEAGGRGLSAGARTASRGRPPDRSRCLRRELLPEPDRCAG
jgi:transketolase